MENKVIQKYVNQTFLSNEKLGNLISKLFSLIDEKDFEDAVESSLKLNSQELREVRIPLKYYKSTKERDVNPLLYFTCEEREKGDADRFDNSLFRFELGYIQFKLEFKQQSLDILFEKNQIPVKSIKAKIVEDKLVVRIDNYIEKSQEI